jgi:hypothetical protein
MTAVTMDTKALELALGDLARDQFPFAASKGLNDLAIRAADVQRADMQSSGRFTIRNPNVLKYGIVRTEKATKQSLASAVGVSQQTTGSREAFGYLKKFEKGGPKLPIQGSTVAVPVDARRNKRGIVAPSARIKAFQFTKHGKQVTGLKRTFMIQPKTGRAAGLILQRVGRGKASTVKVLYVLERSVPIKPILHLAENAVRTARTEWTRIWNDAMTLALRTMRR